MSCFSYKPVYNFEKEETSCAFISESRLKHALTCGLEHFPVFARTVWFCCRYFNTSMGQSSHSDCIWFTLPQAVVLFPFVQVDFTQEMSNSSLSLESIESSHLQSDQDDGSIINRAKTSAHTQTILRGKSSLISWVKWSLQGKFSKIKFHLLSSCKSQQKKRQV